MSKILPIIIIILILFPAMLLAEKPVTGEIININYQYKIAFTDLNNSVLKNGDIVEVRKGGKLFTYLEVSSTSEAISQLIPVQNLREYKTNTPFSKIEIGDTLSKTTAKAFQIKGSYTTTLGIKSEESPIPLSGMKNLDLPSSHNSQESLQGNCQNISQNYITLSNSLAQVLTKKTALEQNNIQSKQELEIAVSRIQELEAETALLNAQVKDLRSKGAIKKSQAKIKTLEATINALKNKLENMALLLEGK